MASTLRYLESAQMHAVSSTQWREKYRLELDPGGGSCLVIAKGTVQAEGVDFNFGMDLRLEVHGQITPDVGADETTFFTDPPQPGSGDRGTFMLLVAAKIPFEGGGTGGPAAVPLPPHRAILLARKHSDDGTGAISDVRIVAVPFDEIIATVLADTGGPIFGD